MQAYFCLKLNLFALFLHLLYNPRTKYSFRANKKANRNGELHDKQNQST